MFSPVVQVREVIMLNGNLTDAHKALIEHWGDEAGTSSLIAGHWLRIARQAASAANLNTVDTVKLLLAVTNGILDATITSWNSKRWFNVGRPLQMVRCGSRAEEDQVSAALPITMILTCIKGTVLPPKDGKCLPTDFLTVIRRPVHHVSLQLTFALRCCCMHFPNEFGVPTLSLQSF